MIVVLLNALNNDEPVWICRKYGVSTTLGGLVPIRSRRAVAPRGGFLWLVEKIGANDRGVASVMLRKHDPVGNPTGLRVVRVPRDVPHIFTDKIVSLGAVAIKEYAQANLPAIINDFVHALKWRESLQIGILRKVNAVGCCASGQHFIAIWNAQRVESKRLHLIKNGFVSACPQTVEDLVAGLKAEPIHAGDAHRVSIGVNYLIAGCGKIASRGTTTTAYGRKGD